MIILKTENLSKEFPGVLALDNVNFDLEEGEIHGIVGENGAGKSTLVKILAGVFPPTRGKIYLYGKELYSHSPRELINIIGFVDQERELIPSFTVIENLFLGNEIVQGGFLKNRELQEKAKTFLKNYNVNLDLLALTRNLSPGQQQMLTIMKVLFRKPKIIIFDEPTASLSVKEIEIFNRLIEELRASKVSIIYISHRLSEVLSFANRITVLRNGKKVVTVRANEVSEKDLIRYMIAKDMHEQYPKIKKEIGDRIFEVKNYANKKYGFNNINFYIKSGEIVGFAGLVGSGRTELAKLIFTGDRNSVGKIIFLSKEFIPKGPKDSINKGIVMIPEKRREEGIILGMSVKDNLALPNLDILSIGGFLKEQAINKHSLFLINSFNIKLASPLQLVYTLSGGNQQKVSVAKWLGERKINLWIFDEPTQGIDVETKTEIYLFMENLAKNGAGVWFISSDLNELLAISDRIYVMNKHKIVGEFSPPYNREMILSKMLGG